MIALIRVSALVWLCVLLLALAMMLTTGPAFGSAGAVTLPASVVQALRAAGISPSQVGVQVTAVDVDGTATTSESDAICPGPLATQPIAPATQPVSIAHGADVPFNPASAMKVLTTHAALALLGPQYRWRTMWLAGGPIVDGALHGDLVLRGGGDPKLVIEDLLEQIRQLRALGLHTIRGDLVIDDSLWDTPRESEPFDGDASQPYNVRPNAAMMNFKATRITLEPVDATSQGTVLLDPPLAGVPIENDAVLTLGACEEPLAKLAVRDSGSDDFAPGIRVGGRWAAACGARSMFAAVLSHRQFVEALFRAAWNAAGGHWQGGARWGWTPHRAAVLLEWLSPRTLADVVRDVNKLSNNVMARSLLLQIGAERAAVPGSTASGAETLRAWLLREGLRMPELVIENGAGLSRVERISAASTVALLRHAAASQHAETLRESLPVVGVDGTMARRLQGEPVAGNAWIKSGSLASVRSAAGYVSAQSGRRYALAIMINGPGAEAAGPAIDELLRWIYANG